MIDTNLINNPKYLGYVKNFGWDTVKLISNKNGNYYFQSEDKKLKDCEGEWWISSNNIEGNCYGHILQKNLKGDVLKFAFDITIRIGGEGFSLPFRKIDSSGDFVEPTKIREENLKE